MDKNFQKLGKDFLDNNTHIYKQTISTPKKKKTKSTSSIFKTAAQKTPVIKKAKDWEKYFQDVNIITYIIQNLKNFHNLVARKQLTQKDKNQPPQQTI